MSVTDRPNAFSYEFNSMKQEVYFKHVSFKVVVRLRCLVECGMGFQVNDADTEINVWIQSCTGTSDDMASIVTLSTWRSLTCSMCILVRSCMM